ncbi:hypothetical protein BD410DRAFT_843337 [Rickenella mellea]|uniref:CxC1-like cysteine cluster associated with KDZ transposases domain-containing protein n=1 Tax=Rickenella mellea TaxID=50990 RepID=A0A4Y7PQX4_9AGAM|nr:hypothetical protein BD410DRAFT_843337 [Rickenella mellea]
MDGNNSLKRTDATIRANRERIDCRQARSDYWLKPEDVDVFKDEVKARPKGKGKASIPDPADEDSNDWQHVPESDPTAICIDRWRNAGPEERKKMFAMFSESGLFLTACRHGFVLLICDMIRSGELMKYPLAMVNKLMDVYGSNIACGYDIGCAFTKTLASSSLGRRARELYLRLLTGAFHGHSHHRGCQLDYHPQYIKGIGLTDAEGCERIFSASNAIASGTRHASKFHRHQAIEEHFSFWDEDKYAALSTFLYNHYREALAIVQSWPAQMAQFRSQLLVTEADFELYLEQERQYLSSLTHEPQEDSLRFNYVEALEELAKTDWENARAVANKLAYGTVREGHAKAVLEAGRHVCTTHTKLQNAETTTAHLENQLAIQGARWRPEDEEYKLVKDSMTERAYRKALDDLELLIVKRLLELTKLNMSGTGYQFRTQIAKALQRRSEAIKNALSRYNTHASKLVPPRPQLTWKEIVEYSFLGEFTLLRSSRSDIREQKWTQPAHREAMAKYFKYHRACEEIDRLNVEIRRLWTAIHDEAAQSSRVIGELSVSNPPLAAELRRRWALRSSVNGVHLSRLRRIQSMPGFSGNCSTGVRERGAHTEHLVSVSSDDVIVQEVIGQDAANAVIVDEEEVLQDFEGMTDFVLSIVE